MLRVLSRALLGAALACTNTEHARAPHQRPGVKVQPPRADAEGLSSGAGGAPCGQFRPPRALGTIADEELSEISGMVASVQQPGVLFVHNDSGDAPRFFAIDRKGQTLAEYHLPGFWLDCEAMALGPAASGADYLYLGDIGDNLARSRWGIARREIQVYRVREPRVPLGRAPSRHLDAVETLRFVYPDNPHDAEALLVDPLTSDLFVLTKESGGRSLLFQADAPHSSAAVRALKYAGELALGKDEQATAGDIARSGDAILVRTYRSTFYWRRSPGSSVAETLRGPAQALPTAPQPQAESIAFSADGRGYYTVSENVRQPLFWSGCW